MRKSLHRYTLPVIALTTGACQPVENSEESAQNSSENSNIQTTASLEKNSPSPAKFVKLTEDKITLQFVTFDSRTHSLEVADQENGLGSEWADAKSAAQAHSAIAAINAGFFTPEEKPLGMVVENGKSYGSFNRSSLGAGIFCSTDFTSVIIRSSEWSSIKPTKPNHLLQSGPILIDHGKTTRGLSNSPSRVRSFLAWDGKNQWCFGHASSCSLHDLGVALSKISLNGKKISIALNLDGGRSSDLWVSSSLTDSGSALTIRPFWNKPVRNFLILKSK